MVAASILAADFAALGAQLSAADEAGVDWFHLDVMDGHFVPNLTFGPPVIQALRSHTARPFDAHLMVERPDDLIPEYVRAGCDAITVHAEACRHLHRTLTCIKSLGVRAGVALSPGTPLSSIEEVLVEVDLVLLMTVHPGFGGQRFMPQMLDKITRCREMLDWTGSRAWLSVDGGITAETASRAVAAGARALVVGSALFNDPRGIGLAVADLRRGAAAP